MSRFLRSCLCLHLFCQVWALDGDVNALANLISEAAEGASLAELDAAIAALVSRRSSLQRDVQAAVLPPVQSVHKHTFATADPEAAVEFVASHLGGHDIKRPDHSCPAASEATGSPVVRDLTLPGATSDLALHFVYNPNKRPGRSRMNATEMGRHVDRIRGNFGRYSNGTGKFDQFMDNHIGLVVSSLDPYVKQWKTAGVPFICRTWCCAAGMPQYPHRCPKYSFGRTTGCEVGCYVEIPYGLTVEFQCGLNSYNESLACLTEVQPDVFDLCLMETDNAVLDHVQAIFA